METTITEQKKQTEPQKPPPPKIVLDVTLRRVIEGNPKSVTIRGLVRAKYNIIIPPKVITKGSEEIIKWIEEQPLPVALVQPEFVELDVSIIDRVNGYSTWTREDARWGKLQLRKKDLDYWIDEARGDTDRLCDFIQQWIEGEGRQLQLKDGGNEIGDEEFDGDSNTNETRYADSVNIKTDLRQFVEQRAAERGH